MAKNDPMKDRRDALDLAIHELKEKRRQFAVSAAAAKQGFEFGIRAQKHVDEYDKAIEILTAMKDEGPLL